MPRPVPTSLLFDSPGPDRPLTPGEAALVADLSPADLAMIDACLLKAAHTRWRKVARVVFTAFDAMEEKFPMLPDVFYGQRVRALVELRVLESQGNLARMRFSEVRLPDPGEEEEEEEEEEDVEDEVERVPEAIPA